MIRALALGLLPAVVFAAAVQIDHVTVAGAKLAKLQAALRAAGIHSVYGGAHSNGVTEMALVSFPDGSYLELIALQDGASAARVQKHEWAAFLAGGAGPCAWAIRAPDMAAETRRLRSAGVAVSEPERGGRERPDGIRLEWETAGIGTATRGTFFPFLIHDLTPRERRANPEGKPTTHDFRGISRIVIGVRNLDDAIKRYRTAFQLPEPIRQVDQDFGARLAWMGNVPVVLAQPLTTDSWLSKRIERFGEAPCAFILAANRPGRFRAASRTRWFGADISWFDPDVPGWRLGFEPAQP
jgi:catechol 2,3-dioxygenase-like lactoylglutathione lyase family enzyme